MTSNKVDDAGIESEKTLLLLLEGDSARELDKWRVGRAVYKVNGEREAKEEEETREYLLLKDYCRKKR